MSTARGVLMTESLVFFFRYHVETYQDTYGDYSAEVHLFPFRTEKLSPAAPMILH